MSTGWYLLTQQELDPSLTRLFLYTFSTINKIPHAYRWCEILCLPWRFFRGWVGDAFPLHHRTATR